MSTRDEMRERFEAKFTDHSGTKEEFLAFVHAEVALALAPVEQAPGLAEAEKWLRDRHNQCHSTYPAEALYCARCMTQRAPDGNNMTDDQLGKWLTDPRGAEMLPYAEIGKRSRALLATREVELAAWKESAMDVLSRWDKVAAELSRGQSIPMDIDVSTWCLGRAAELAAKLSTAEATIARQQSRLDEHARLFATHAECDAARKLDQAGFDETLQRQREELRIAGEKLADANGARQLLQQAVAKLWTDVEACALFGS